jgi:hypothetical protein
MFALSIGGVAYGTLADALACGLALALLLIKLVCLTSGVSASTGRSTLLSSFELFAAQSQRAFLHRRFALNPTGVCHDH